MSQSASQIVPLHVFARIFPQVSRAAIAAAIFGLTVTFPPAHAYDEIDASPYRVPGEGPPYATRLDPRDWPPMPAKRSYVFQSDGYNLRPSEAYKETQRWKHKRTYTPNDESHEGGHRDSAVDDYPDPRNKYAAHGDEDPKGRHEYPNDTLDSTEDGSHDEGYGRLFPKATYDEASSYEPASFKALQALGQSMVEEGGIDDPTGDSEMPAGYTFFGQFIDHDLTLETTTDLGHEIQGDYELKNSRTPDLDLDSVYGGGPKVTPHLYRLPYIRVGPATSGDDEQLRHDLFRTKSSYHYGPTGGQAMALLGDPRNDENIILSQLHAAFVAFHNRTVDILVERDFGQEREAFCGHATQCDTSELAEALPTEEKAKIFESAHDHTIHFYHRLILEDFLPRVIGPQHTASLLKHGRDFFFPDGFENTNGRVEKVHIPIEFSVAAFRYGHSQVRDSYMLREEKRVRLLSGGDDEGLRAFAPVTPRLLVDWRYFFEIGYKPPYGFNYARHIDPELVKSLHRLHFSNIVGVNDVTSLAVRNLARSKSLHLPSGQQVAAIVLPALQARGLLGKGDEGFTSRYPGKLWQAYLLPPDERTVYFLGNSETPLWYYILQEANIFGRATHLHAAPYEGDEQQRLSGDYPSGQYGDYFRPASAKHRYGQHSDHGDRYGDNDNPDGGHRLGPVGATIVGEVLVGLIDHYRETTGKGLDYHPQIKGSESILARLDSKKTSGHRYLMRNFLIDAGVVQRD